MHSRKSGYVDLRTSMKWMYASIVKSMLTQNNYLDDATASEGEAHFNKDP